MDRTSLIKVEVSFEIQKLIPGSAIPELPCSWTVELDLVKHAGSDNTKGIMTPENGCRNI